MFSALLSSLIGNTNLAHPLPAEEIKLDKERVRVALGGRDACMLPAGI
jgi:hypothetical protein